MNPPDPLFGVWEGAGGCIVLLDHGEQVRVYQRVMTEEGAVAQSLLLRLDGSPTTIDGSTYQARRVDGVLEIDADVQGLPAKVSRSVEEGVLIETLQVGKQSVCATYQRSATKQVMVYRRDLKMRKGKIAAQCAHGSMAVFFRRDQGQPGQLLIPLDGPMEHWSRKAFAKIVLSVDDEEGLLEIHRLALASGLPTAVITDAGRTEFHGVPTRTVVAIGPAALGEIDRITGPGGVVACKLA